jgi:WD40 repeat protein
MSSYGRQPPPDDGRQPKNVPNAPYPPMISTRFPSAQLSSLRSSPHFSALLLQQQQQQQIVKDGAIIAVNSNSAPTLLAASNEAASPLRASGAVDDATTITARNSNNSNTNNNDKITARARLPARAQFCQWDVLACINCVETQAEYLIPRPLPPQNLVEETTSSTTPTRTNTRRLGPLLLELRRLNFEANRNFSDLFEIITICQSRGNPSLGSSVSSTCLDIARSAFLLNQYGGGYAPPCATGLTTGALCIHSFARNDELTPSVEYYHLPGHHRPATAVAWRPSNDSHVAIGWTGPTGSSSSLINTSERQTEHVRRTLQVGGGAGGGGGGGAKLGDREYCCSVWDVEHQSPQPQQQQPPQSAFSPANRRTKTVPLYKLSHNAGVASLGWVLDGGQTLVVGGQQRNLQIYDLRVSATSAAPPVAVFGHNFGVHGIEVDPCRLWHFATYSRAAGEAVKLWDVRRMDSQLTEIKIGGASKTPSAVTSVKWSTSDVGHISILVGDYLHQYDTLTSGSRPVHTNTIRTGKPIEDFTHYPFADLEEFGSSDTPSSGATLKKKKVFSELLSKRIVAVEGNQTLSVVAAHRIAPIVVSHRTGQVIHTLGRTLWLESASEGPAAMEYPDIRSNEDISATMMRRAGCLHVAKYSMAASPNIKMLASELSGSQGASSLTTTNPLLRLWRWIERAEALCSEPADDSFDESNWPAKGLVDAGVLKLLELDEGQSEGQSYSDSLSCATYDSAGRR